MPVLPVTLFGGFKYVGAFGIGDKLKVFNKFININVCGNLDLSFNRLQ